MIIAACTDDPMVTKIAREASEKAPETFGSWHKVFDKNIPDLEVDEDLFIVAHGAAIGDEGQPVIGSREDAFYLTARDLNSNLHIFPSGYAAGVYVYTCLSAVKGATGLSFVETYQAIIGPSFPGLTAYGQTGKPHGPLPGPEDPSWVKAE